MDRSWIKAKRTSLEYDKGVRDFLDFARRNADDDSGMFYCPCIECLNEKRLSAADVYTHLICEGFCKSYTVWVWHGEELEMPGASQQEGRSFDDNDTDLDDRIEDIIRDVGEEAFDQSHAYGNMCSDAEKPLYPGCTKYQLLKAVLKLVSLKARHGWSDKSFSEMLMAFKDMLPDDNVLPSRYYDAKKILCPLGMKYKKIHACRNDCILYRKEHEEKQQCPICETPRYKSNVAPAKVLWYLPIIPRFKRLFANENDAKNLRWHMDERISDGKLRHPADSLQWKKIDQLFPSFGEEPRNLRLGLSTDGMNPYGSLSSIHSSWPVLLVIYNLSPLLCMKRKYMLLSMLISGPKQPGNDIDVYLEPLIEDLKELWHEGVDVFDANKKEIFKMRAMIFCTINDFPAYGNLSGYSVKGHKACLICEEGTCNHQLQHGRKTIYLGHRRFLTRGHPYRRLKKAFVGGQEFEVAPKALTGEEVYEKVKNINVIFGKTTKSRNEKNIWKKRSVFFDLPYWRILDVRHCIDFMHVEKNVCDSIVGTLLNIQGSSKDGVKARLDLQEMGIREELHPRPYGKRTFCPPASHTLSKDEKRSFCECLHGIKVPSGYSSNFQKLVSMKDLKLIGLKSHDCHVLMQQLLPVAIRGIAEYDLQHVLTRLCFFFNSICSKVIETERLDELENEGYLILCQLEKLFLPSFFDIMVHLIVHLVREIKLCGPIYFRWMYPIERTMKILKGYVKNPNRPEASIVQKYVSEEAMEFCQHYLSNVGHIGLPKRHNEEGGRRGATVKSVDHDELQQVHLYILNNVDEVQDYMNAHKEIVRKENSRMTEQRLIREHNRTFTHWFKQKVNEEGCVSDTVKWLARGPEVDVISWTSFVINGYTFYTKSLDDSSTVQNSGVMLVAESMHFSSSKDKNPKLAAIAYYGVIEEIWVVDYVKIRFPIFKCKWVDINTGVKIDRLGFTLVDLHSRSFGDEPFIMAYQARQVFYITDQANKMWSVALQGKRVIDIDEESHSSYDLLETPSFSRGLPELNEEDEADNEHGTRNDHHEGIWEDIPL